MKTLTQTESNTNPVTRTEFISGIVTGQIAGLIMAVVVMLVFTLFLGKGPLFPVQVIGSMALGESALQGTNFLAIIAGLIFHQLGPSLLWGILFGLIATKFSITTKKDAAIWGLVVGVISMVGPYLLIPTLMHHFHGTDFWNQNVPMFWDWAAHFVFGLSFVFYPSILKKLKSSH